MRAALIATAGTRAASIAISTSSAAGTSVAGKSSQ
jgi:hypothetical protein